MRGPTLRIVSVNDVYTLENLPRLATLLAHHRTTDPADAFLAVLAGDFLAPSILSSLDAGKGMVDCLNAAGITHVIFGNHEDDVTPAQLHARLREFRGTWLSTNVHGFDPPLPTHQVLEVAGPGRRVRVALIGVVMTDDTIYRRQPFGGAEIEPANAAALRMTARLLHDEGCVCVVPITHQPIEEDRALALAQREPPFPVIVGGHEHVVMVEQVETTWIVKAGQDALRGAVTDLRWPAEAPAAGPDSPAVAVRLDPVARYPEDAAMRARVDGHMARVHALESATLMKVPEGEALSSVGSRARQTSLGTLICSLLRDALDADACLFNGGGIRGGREYRGHFTYGDLKAEVPFDNEIVVVRLPGAVVRDAVTASRAHAPAESGGFLQVDDRVLVTQPGDVVTAIDGVPLVEGRDYRVALVRDLLLGLDHIEPLIRFGREHPERLPPPGCGRDVKLALVDAFATALWDRLGGFDAIDADHDGRITASEIAAAVARETHEAPSEVAAQLLLSALDKDHDGTVSRAEADAEVEAAKRRRGKA
ncbi:MAG TPA: 5'-nucleotidase C-terminal domain-containing protein [Polyangiaceae bacterium]